MSTPPNLPSEVPAPPASAAPMDAPSARISDFGRIAGVIYSPGATFRDIVARPTWLMPLLLLLVLSMVVFTLFGQRVGWRSMMEKQMDKNPSVASMSPEQREQAIERAVKFAPPFIYGVGVVATFVVPVIVAGMLLLAFNVVGGARINFKTALAIVAFSWMPLAIHALLSILLLFLKSPDTIDLEHLVGSNPGAFLSSESPKWLMTLTTSLDIFTFWCIVLAGIGFSAANPKKISVAKGITTVAICWAIWVGIRVAWAGAFS